MNSRKHIQEELENLGCTLPLSANVPLSVPEGYFDGFATEMLEKVKLSQLSATDELVDVAPFLAQLPKHPTLSVPSNYFANLAATIPAFIDGEESPLLDSISRSMPNTLPANYFEGLSTQIVAKVEKPATKIISINRRSWMRMAVAAVVAGIMAVGGIAYFNNGGTTNSVQSTAWVEKGLKGVSDATLTDFIETTDAVHEGDVASTNVNTSEVRHLLTDVSEGEMDAFLAQVPTDDEELLIIN